LSREPLWRYVNVHRVCLAIIKNLLVNLQWTVFEPNDQRLWDAIVAVLQQFFGDLFASGALVGATPAQAFFVKCDAQTNRPDTVARGEVITHVGFAPVRPAEFVLVTIKRTATTLSVSEQGVSR
jgi:phage tail sheath protein FI